MYVKILYVQNVYGLSWQRGELLLSLLKVILTNISPCLTANSVSRAKDKNLKISTCPSK